MAYRIVRSPEPYGYEPLGDVHTHIPQLHEWDAPERLLVPRIVEAQRLEICRQAREGGMEFVTLLLENICGREVEGSICDLQIDRILIIRIQPIQAETGDVHLALGGEGSEAQGTRMRHAALGVGVEAQANLGLCVRRVPESL